MSKIATLAIIKKSKLSRVKIQTPEWGKDTCIYVRMLPGSSQEQVSGIFTNKRIPEKERNVRLLLLFACDETGKPIFDESAIPVLLEKAMGPTQRAVNEALELNGFGDAAQEAIEGN